MANTSPWADDGRRLRGALFFARTQAVVTVTYLALDAVSLAGVFEWPARALTSIVAGCLALHVLCLVSVCKAFSDRAAHRPSVVQRLGFLAVATAPAGLLGLIAFHAGVEDPAGLELPMCLILMAWLTWTGASIAGRMFDQDTAAPSGTYRSFAENAAATDPYRFEVFAKRLSTWLVLFLPIVPMTFAGLALNKLAPLEPGFAWWVVNGLLGLVTLLLTYGAIPQSYRLLPCLLLATSHGLIAAAFFSSVALVLEIWAGWGLLGGVLATLILGFLPASYLVFIPLALIALGATGDWGLVADVTLLVGFAVFLRWGNVGRPFALSSLKLH